MKEELFIRHYPILSSERKPDKAVEVEYVRVPHYSDMARKSGKKLTAYEVIVDGVNVGKIHQVEYTSSGTYAGSRIRRDYGTVCEWAWQRTAEGGKPPVYNPPGLYAKSRRSAVAKILGYDEAHKVNV